MPRTCAICVHPRRAEIEAALIAGQSTRSIGAAFGIDHRAIHRHAQRHLPGAITDAAIAHVAYLDALDAPSHGGIAIPDSQEPAEATPEAESHPALAMTSRPSRAIQLDDLPPPLQAASVQPVAPPLVEPEPTQAPLVALGIVATIEDLRDRALGILATAEASGDAKTALAAIREARGVLEMLSRLEPVGTSTEATPLANAPEWQRVRTALFSALAPFPEARIVAAAALIAMGALT